jgi:acyl transferase domain-containing protein
MSAAMPIAVIGRGAVLPGAHDLAELWARVMGRDDLTGPSTAAMWGLQPSAVCADPVEPSACARGGYVTGFAETWRPEGFLVAPDLLATLPEGWQWLLHATRESLKEAAISLGAGTRAGLALGSLGYATRAFADVAARRWCGEVDADSPALEGQTGALHWTMQACGLEGPRLALDAACASGLYALKAACDALQARRADVMVAAGLNAADDLFLHIGFTALSALSPTGRSSRPQHRGRWPAARRRRGGAGAEAARRCGGGWRSHSRHHSRCRSQQRRSRLGSAGADHERSAARDPRGLCGGGPRPFER